MEDVVQKITDYMVQKRLNDVKLSSLKAILTTKTLSYVDLQHKKVPYVVKLWYERGYKVVIYKQTYYLLIPNIDNLSFKKEIDTDEIIVLAK